MCDLRKGAIFMSMRYLTTLLTGVRLDMECGTAGDVREAVDLARNTFTQPFLLLPKRKSRRQAGRLR